MAAEQLHFVPAKQQSLRLSTRDMELIQADPKSHARRISHILSQTQGHLKACAPGHPGTCLVWRGCLGSKVSTKNGYQPKVFSCSSARTYANFPWTKRHLPLEYDKQRSQLKPSITAAIGEINGCDPFVEFPTALSKLDRQLFHFSEWSMAFPSFAALC